MRNMLGFLMVALVLNSCASPPKKSFSIDPSAQARVYELPKLPYAYSALAPVIDAKTMEIHHSKHHQTYVTNLNQALEGTPWAKVSLEELFSQVSGLPQAIRNHGGGHYNHDLFWKMMAPASKTGQPSEALRLAIEKKFGTIERFKLEFEKAAATRFGSGWAWLIVKPSGELAVTSTPNQDNPLMDVVTERGYPLLALDVWEHAYYLNYQNRRADYSKEWWKVVHWSFVSERYENWMKQVVPQV